MAPVIEQRPFFENPNTIPLKAKGQPVMYPSSPPPTISRDNYYQSKYDRERSPPQPVQPFRVYEDNTAAEEWQADRANLYDQLEKLTLKLDTVNVLVSSQTQRITDLEKVLKEKEALIKEYQKTLRSDRANKETTSNAMRRVLEQCERFKSEIVKLSHHIHQLHNAIVNAEDAGQLQAEFVKLKHEGDLTKHKKSARVAGKGGT